MICLLTQQTCQMMTTKKDSIKKILFSLLAACLSMTAMAQEKYEKGKPNDDNYRYLDNYLGLKKYIDYSKYPNFKLGVGTTVNDYLQKGLVYKLTNANFTETVAGNAMKMASCVDYNNGNMNFTRVTNYVNAATQAGINVYGHTLAWHSQQPKNWLLSLMADKPDPSGGTEYTTIASKDFRLDKTIGWTSTKTDWDFTTSFGAATGLNITTNTSYPWQVQVVPMDNIQLTAGQTYKLTMKVKGSGSGQLNCSLKDWQNSGVSFSIPFTTDWNEVEVSVKPTINNNFVLAQVANFVGTVNIQSIKFEGYKGKLVPQTMQEKHDTLVYAMDKWIKGMMNACGGKVKGWDLVNEAISGGDGDGDGNYDLQHSEGYKSGTWDVGGDAFYWQDYMGDLEYVRQACRLARKYGPEDVKLFINDYNLEGVWDIVTKDGISASKKLWSLVNWIKKWEADGVTKIDGIGTQMHISFNKKESSQNSLKNAITGMFKLMAKSGKMVRVSELDMGYNDINGNSVSTSDMTEAQHKEMANFYEWIIQQFLTIVPPEQQWGICQWCANDNNSQGGWRANTPVGIWDVNNYRKHVYAGFVRGLNGGEPTEIDNVKAEETVDTSKGIYNINGVRMSATSIEELPAGLYIVNGKKICK